jgi:deoxyadenosine/deoxycytidine kinase
MVRVSKIVKKTWSKTINVADAITITLNCTDEMCEAVYNNNVVSRLYYSQLSRWCFRVEDYLVCLDKDDIVGG